MPMIPVRALMPALRWLAAAALALLAGCANLSLPGLPFLRNDAPPPVRIGGPPLNWGDRIDAPLPSSPAYVIGPEDALEVSVWRDETLKSAVLVRPDGGISFPLAGDFIVAGMTAAQVRDELVRRLEKFVPEPVVTVTVVRVSSVRIYVIGRVNKPGELPLGRNIDVLQALSIAGGLTPFASEDEIRIIRKIDGKPVSIPFQYSRIRKHGDLSQNITLQSGDVLLVP